MTEYLKWWEIIDDNGILYSGHEEEIRIIFSDIITGKNKIHWKGDLKLIEIKNIYKTKTNQEIQ